VADLGDLRHRQWESITGMPPSSTTRCRNNGSSWCAPNSQRVLLRIEMAPLSQSAPISSPPPSTSTSAPPHALTAASTCFGGELRKPMIAAVSNGNGGVKHVHAKRVVVEIRNGTPTSWLAGPYFGRKWKDVPDAQC
jgi:hypothetical protein